MPAPFYDDDEMGQPDEDEPDISPPRSFFVQQGFLRPRRVPNPADDEPVVYIPERLR